MSKNRIRFIGALSLCAFVFALTLSFFGTAAAGPVNSCCSIGMAYHGEWIVDPHYPELSYCDCMVYTNLACVHWCAD